MESRCGAYGEKGIFISTRSRGNNCVFQTGAVEDPYTLFVSWWGIEDLTRPRCPRKRAPTIHAFLSVQSVAFKMLKTRLKPMRPHDVMADQGTWTSSGNPHAQIIQMPDGSNHDMGNTHDSINFASRLQQFQHMQSLHRMHSTSQQSTQNSYPAISSQIEISGDSQPSVPAPESLTRRSSRSSGSSPGQPLH
ncbi:hypothetical protein IEQ34_020071 [Dendrobium chrysotoxum]|uniref:Uncharacterized protein n=1 Tax=Dendrobium chrysotoxum TaxID=161865 RepID=A0AAV7FZY1_DENCH|nr:hypothetical protein IEQ34_020071 [Dendrobium chrysotoxum]